MTRYANRGTIIVTTALKDTANALLEKHGYGPNNISQPLVGINSADDANPVAWYCDMPVDLPLRKLIKKHLVRPNVDAFITPRTDRGLDAKLAQKNVKRRYDQEGRFRVQLAGVQRLFAPEAFDPTYSVRKAFELSGGINNIMQIGGNISVCIPIAYEITSNTRLRFDFLSRSEGQFHGIGFDNNKVMSWNVQYQLHGTATVGIQTYNNYSGTSYKAYNIPIGQLRTGTARYLVFSALDNNEQAESVYRNVRLTES